MKCIFCVIAELSRNPLKTKRLRNTCTLHEVRSKPAMTASALVSIALFLSSCYNFEKDISADFAKFPPKLAVTAILDCKGESGESKFTITIGEGRALADYIEGVPYSRTIKALGSITLYEDNVEIFTHSGEFDMSIEKQSGYWNFDEGELVEEQVHKNGYRYERSGFVTRAGRTYRLEVDVEGYPAVRSVATMPALPAITATADTTTLVTAQCIREFGSLQGSSGGTWGGDWSMDFCTVTLRLNKRSSVNNYYALELFENGNTSKIFVSDLSYFPDNPDVEASNVMGDIFVDTDKPDMFSFPLFLMNDGNFPRDNASLNFYSAFRMPPPSEGHYEIHTTQNLLSLRIRHITAETFKYYRSLALQSNGMGFFSEPVNVVGNIENGYGIFSVYNTKDIKLLD